MTHLLRRLAALVALLVLAGPAGAMDMAESKLGDLTVQKPWARASIGTDRPSAAFMVITNGGGTDDRLTAVTTEIAGKAELHKTSMDNGVMKMREVEGGIIVPAGATVELKPKDLHIMLMGLKAPLVEGEMVTLTLTFEKAGTLTLKAMIMKAGATSHSH